MLFTPLWGPRLVYGKHPGQLQEHCPDRLRFSLRDIACLFVYLAIANALFRLMRGEYSFFPTLSILVSVMANLFAFLAWILAFRFADCWNIATTLGRVLAMLAFFPLSAVAVAQGCMSCLMLLSGLEAFSDGLIAGLARYVSSPISIASCAMILFNLVMVYALRRLWRVVVSRMAEPNVPERD